MITAQKALRAAFWESHPDASRKLIKDYSGRGRMHCTDTRTAWCDFIDLMARDGQISESMANRATLRPSVVKSEYDILGSYDDGQTWDVENTESTWADAKRSIGEYRTNGGGVYKLKRRRVLESRE